MGGGGSKSTSKPVYTPQQKEVFKWMQGNVVPLAEGKETYLTQLMAQRARDEAAQLQNIGQQNTLQAAGVAGMSAGQIGQSLQNQQQQTIQAVLANILQNRLAMQQQALQMIGNIPMSPGQESVQKGEDPFKSTLGRAGGKLIGMAGGAALGGLIGGAPGAMAGLQAMGGSIQGGE